MMAFHERDKTMKHEQRWRLRADYVRWMALLTPKVWSGVPLEHSWIDGHSAYSFSAECVSADGGSVDLKLANGLVVPVALAMLGPEERRRVQRDPGNNGKAPTPQKAA